MIHRRNFAPFLGDGTELLDVVVVLRAVEAADHVNDGVERDGGVVGSRQRVLQDRVRVPAAPAVTKNFSHTTGCLHRIRSIFNFLERQSTQRNCCHHCTHSKKNSVDLVFRLSAFKQCEFRQRVVVITQGSGASSPAVCPGVVRLEEGDRGPAGPAADREHDVTRDARVDERVVEVHVRAARVLQHLRGNRPSHHRKSPRICVSKIYKGPLSAETVSQR